MIRLTIAAVLLAVFSGCAQAAPNPDLAGVRLPKATARPAFTLTATDGTRYDFHARTRGRLTLLFFGYTNCPDVCPATMANLGAVMAKLTSEDRRRIDVVFVTTDPDRDTPTHLAKWLGGFDREIVGLTGTAEQLASAQRASGVAVAVRDSSAGRYTVSHAAQVLVYSPDDSSHIAYPFGTRQSQWAADLPVLLTRWSGPR